MASRRVPEAKRLEAPLLFLSRDESGLSVLLPKLLGPAARKAVLKAAGLPALAGAAGARRIAVELARKKRLLHALTDELAASLPAPAAESTEATGEQLLATVHGLLQSENQDDWALLASKIEAWGDRLPSRKDPKRKPAASPAKPTPIARETSPEDRVREAKAALKTARQEIARLEKEVANAHRENERLREEINELQARLRDADQRASETKRRLAVTTAPADREALLEKKASDFERLASIAEQKLQIVELERDDFRACLEDTDRFLLAAEEEVPSFRDRPLLAVEQELADRLAAKALTPRILVIGGGEPQRRHHDKFHEYAEVMGFRGDWRMAEYVSWHKEMKGLAADMRDRFDALVILHWNRTTFTRNAREICNQEGQRPCITCHYEGFTSLRETLQECLRQLLAAGTE